MRVLVKRVEAPSIDINEVLRYACSSSKDKVSEQLAAEAISIAKDSFSYSVCYAELPFVTDGKVSDFSVFRVESEKLSKCLYGSSKVLLFAATVGIGVDRLIAKYLRLSPAKALMLGALGAERIEALCNTFCAEYKTENCVSLTPRFSAGYGDCPLDVQREIFAILDCSKNIGLTLNDSMLMSPTKSVTAFVGIKEK